MSAYKLHPATRELLGWFTADHLPEGRVRETSLACSELAWIMADLPNGQADEVTHGLRKLLEAKDCFVRAAIAAERDAS